MRPDSCFRILTLFFRFIAILLVIFGWTVDETLKCFNNVIGKLTTYVNDTDMDPGQRSAALRNIIKDLLVKHGIGEDTTLDAQNPKDAGCKL
jgi:hypothetical protein